MAIRLIIGLGNPGSEYKQTRHNAGFWFLDMLGSDLHCSFKAEKRFSGDVARCLIEQQDCRLLKPMTFMNRSGLPAASLMRFFDIAADEILVVHDELDLSPGVARLKRGGGHGGHNGLRDLISHLGSKDYLRLRMGIGHPGHKSQVSDYVLKAPSQTDRQQIENAMYEVFRVIPAIMANDIEQAMHQLHSQC
ncbi:MAG: aminoacyl-tRNA hydrolase [Gammaproteobacteria bacterium]